MSAAAGLLAELRGGGLRVAIDDFGTGYSSLAYLKALPLDYLKIDKRLCQDIAGSPRDRIVVRSVIDMARSLGLDVIAEGVETEAQLSLLAEEGCTLYQGFLCAPPLSSAELAALVAAMEAWVNLSPDGWRFHFQGGSARIFASPFDSCSAPLRRASGSAQARVMTSLLSGRSLAVPLSRST